mmetsp:Transcript_11737/g.30441  ORF Transcript_11737/g.30441 Transcript_11737/m.30441 type:complete len:115 (-) Transcript_11737:686-1030(-)
MRAELRVDCRRNNLGPDGVPRGAGSSVWPSRDFLDGNSRERSRERLDDPSKERIDAPSRERLDPPSRERLDAPLDGTSRERLDAPDSEPFVPWWHADKGMEGVPSWLWLLSLDL